MIKIENTEVVGWEHAIRGMRNPYNSWEKSDSYEAVDCNKCGLIEEQGICTKEDRVGRCENYKCYVLGKNDLTLMNKLASNGPVHAKYRRMIVVYVDITAPLFMLKELDTYRMGVEKNSCSTMHTIQKKEFAAEDFSFDNVCIDDFKPIIETLNHYRDAYNNYDGFCNELMEMGFAKENLPSRKSLWRAMIELLPSAYNQKRTYMFSYEALANIYYWRKDHKLEEWKSFCKWIEQLPYSELITGVNHDND